jgi:hypothetical protein
VTPARESILNPPATYYSSDCFRFIAEL